jgi:Domain of unknown function (DUF4062)
MPSNVTKYRVFVASPSGLDDIRRSFHTTLTNYNRLEAVPRNVLFEPVGWEATLPGVGRPQELINADIRSCDHAVFIFRDRWGSATGGRFSSGCEEEWALCNELVADQHMQSVQLLFLPVPAAQLKDPGAQLRQVQTFRQQIEAGKQHLCKALQADDDFATELQMSLGH